MALINNWNTRQIDFILVYLQAEIECDLYMKLPIGFETTSGDYHSHVLLLKYNLYSQRQGSKIWNNHLVKRLKKIGFELLKVDKSIFYEENMIFFYYIDSDIFIGPNDKEIDDAVQQLKDLKYNVEEIEDIEDYISIYFKR